MPLIYQVSPRHGKHIASTIQEAEYNNKYGWKDVPEKDFYRIPNNPEGITSYLKGEPLPEVKRRGRPPNADSA